MNTILFSILGVLFGIEIFPKIFSKDKSLIWNPVVFMCIYLTYYVLMPYIKGGGDASEAAQTYLLLGSILFYSVFRFTFLRSAPSYRFDRINDSLTQENAVRISIWLFALAFVGYGIFNGFSLSILSNESRSDIVFDENGSYGHTEMYITNLISIFTFSCSAVYAAKNKITPVFIALCTISMIIYIVGGFRYRILILFVVVALVVYLYPQAKKIKYHIVIPIFLAIYVLMGVMEATRMYGRGLDAGALLELRQSGTIEESSENMMVYEFSAECMQKYDIEDYIWFEPITNAICMPIPRALFPWKPKGLYMREANMKIYGTITHGSAFLNITEAYVSFGWFGIIFYAIFLGWLSKLFWLNYRENASSIGAVVLLGLYNGVLYQIVARGYMAQALTTFVYYVFMPFWLLMLLRKFKIIKD